MDVALVLFKPWFRSPHPHRDQPGFLSDIDDFMMDHTIYRNYGVFQLKKPPLIMADTGRK
ncbi:MAG TPA: hypothetical protein DEQ75_07695 [Alphaproteobacteria bacterium]|nr:hypothetical protein [Alphaproteobacteria bacterium]